MEEEKKLGMIINTNITEEMKTSYLNYAMSVIVSRALPDVRDGLKPVHRRILYGMHDMGIKATGANKKCARIVGDVLGKYHPHGDASVYDALVRLAQDFSLRYPVVSPQGNFGSVDGDTAAAMRYTEAKMSRLGDVMLEDLDKETVDFGPNYDESLQEPLVLPARFPFLLANGSSGIAVGMATNMAPHNLREICAAINAVIDNPDIDILALMQYIKGPDFPTSGIICGQAGIRDAFLTGKGKIVVRGKYEIEDHKSHEAIVFTEIPYQVNKAELVKKINELSSNSKDNTNKLKEEIALVRDESGRDGMRIFIELKKDVDPNLVLNRLFEETQLQINFNINNLALVNGKPEQLNLKQMLNYYIKHREDVVTRRINFDLRKAKEREHILEGLKIGLDNIDSIIEIIKKAPNNDVACEQMIEQFYLDDIQAKAIINMRLGRLSHMETQEILDELAEILQKIAYFEDILSDETKLLGVIKDETNQLAADYGDARRTQINPQEIGGAVDKDFVKKEEVVVTISHKGFCKRVSTEEYHSQSRGGMGSKGVGLRDEDFCERMFTANSHDKVLFITTLGRAFEMDVYEIAEGSKTSKGVSVRNLLPKLGENEAIAVVLCYPEDLDTETHYVFMATRLGTIKKTALTDFKNARKNGVIAIILKEGDSIKSAELIQDGDEAMIVSKFGKGLRFSCDSVRRMGRVTQGVLGMKLSEDDEIVGLIKVNQANNVLMLTNVGKGKRVAFDEFMQHGRNTGGQKIYRLDDDNYLVAALGVNDENDVVAITKNGITIRTNISGISLQGRSAAGVKVITMKTEDDVIVAVAETIHEQEMEDEEVSEQSVEKLQETSEIEE